MTFVSEDSATKGSTNCELAVIVTRLLSPLLASPGIVKFMEIFDLPLRASGPVVLPWGKLISQSKREVALNSKESSPFPKFLICARKVTVLPGLSLLLFGVRIDKAAT